MIPVYGFEMGILNRISSTAVAEKTHRSIVATKKAPSLDEASTILSPRVPFIQDRR